MSTILAVDGSTILVRNNIMSNRIKELRDLLGLSQQRLAELANTTNQQIGRLESGSRKLSQDWMERLAPVLGVNPAELLPVGEIAPKIPLVGNVQAGVWKEANGDDPQWISVPIPHEFLKLRAYALRVVGTSMNTIYPEGTILICCHLEELNEQPRPGKRYIIENINPHGEIEQTVKEFQRDETGRPWAWPRSTDPRWQQPVPLDSGRDGHTISVRARVVYALRPE